VSTQAIEMSSPQAFDKAAWQRQWRKKFVEENGFSTAANYATGGLRKAVLERDGYACVECGITDAEHKRIWDRPITVDHRDKDRKHNTMDNLQTLCLTCHGRKDLIPELRTPIAPTYKEQIIELRSAGKTYREVAAATGLALCTIYKWDQIWNKNGEIYERRTRSNWR
jgi:HNH endonuclease/Helix-turn-helix domain